MHNNEELLACPIGGTLGIIAGKWKPEILWHLTGKTLRFNQLQRAIGRVSQKMLTQQLRELQRDGMVTRTQYEQIPPRVEYSPTKLADSLKPLFGLLIQWHDEHGRSIQKARGKYDRGEKNAALSLQGQN
jgi:DNA-binding HxlR family transcriptional regulator